MLYDTRLITTSEIYIDNDSDTFKQYYACCTSYSNSLLEIYDVEAIWPKFNESSINNYSIRVVGQKTVINGGHLKHLSVTLNKNQLITGLQLNFESNNNILISNSKEYSFQNQLTFGRYTYH